MLPPTLNITGRHYQQHCCVVGKDGQTYGCSIYRSVQGAMHSIATFFSALPYAELSPTRLLSSMKELLFKFLIV